MWTIPKRGMASYIATNVDPERVGKSTLVESVQGLGQQDLLTPLEGHPLVLEISSNETCRIGHTETSQEFFDGIRNQGAIGEQLSANRRLRREAMRRKRQSGTHGVEPAEDDVHQHAAQFVFVDSAAVELRVDHATEEIRSRRVASLVDPVTRIGLKSHE